jgi:hypothetical protein
MEYNAAVPGDRSTRSPDNERKRWEQPPCLEHLPNKNWSNSSSIASSCRVRPAQILPGFGPRASKWPRNCWTKPRFFTRQNPFRTAVRERQKSEPGARGRLKGRRLRPVPFCCLLVMARRLSLDCVAYLAKELPNTGPGSAALQNPRNQQQRLMREYFSCN